MMYETAQLKVVTIVLVHKDMYPFDTLTFIRSLYVTKTSSGNETKKFDANDANTIPPIPYFFTNITSKTKFNIAEIICLGRVLFHNPAAPTYVPYSCLVALE